MATPGWPNNVPYAPQRDAYAMSKRWQDLLVSEVEDGPRRQRRTNTGQWSQHSYSIRMTLAQYETFDAFVALTLGAGAARFTMPVGRLGAPKPWPAKLAYIEGGQFTAKAEAVGYVMVSFVLNVLDW
jgi:hypothetical protein